MKIILKGDESAILGINLKEMIDNHRQYLYERLTGDYGFRGEKIHGFLSRTKTGTIIISVWISNTDIEAP